MRTSSTVLVLAVVLVAATSTVDAHFKLLAPESQTVQESNGDPQKTGPCGGAGTASNKVTAVMTGSMLTLSIDETIYHPGHYRVAIAQTEGQLPAPPAVTTGSTACGSVPIVANPTLPILADGVFRHSSTFAGVDQTTQIQLPAGYRCDNCVVQVMQWMSNHTAPCFYYHCAKVTISDAAPPPPPVVDAGVAGGDAGTTPIDDDATGCCDSGRRKPSSGASLLGVLVALAILRPRRRR